MICKHCHKKNNYNHKYCFYCGELLNDEEQDTTIEQQDIDSSSDMSNLNISLNTDTGNESDETDSSPELIENYDSDAPDKQSEELSSLPANDNNLKDLLFNIDQPEEEQKASKKKLLPFVLAILAIVCIVVLIIKINPLTWFTDKEIEQQEELMVTYTVEPTQIEDGTEAHQIILYIPDGESVSLLGQSAPVTNGRADFIVTNGVIEKMAESNEDKLTLQATIFYKSGNQKQEQIIISSFSTTEDLASATYTLLKPASLSVESQETSIAFEVQLATTSTIFINDENYTDKIGDNDILSISLPVDDTQTKTIYNIKIEQPNKAPVNETLTITYNAGEAVNTVTEDIHFDSDISSPIVLDSSSKSITLTGKTSPEAKITNTTNEVTDITINEAGVFSLTIEPVHTGYNLFNLSFDLPNDNTIEKTLVLDYTPSLSEYVRSAWAPDPYDYLTKIEDAHNGEHFILTGNIQAVINKENNHTNFLLELATNKNEVYYVEYWGEFNYKANDSIAIFGNKWGLKKGYPFILCKKITQKK